MNFYELKNRPHFLPLLFATTGILLLGVLFFTQFPYIMQTSSSIDSKRSEVAQLQESVDYISTYPNDQLEQDVEVVNLALPPEKDVTLVFGTISRLARDSNVLLESYSVTVGDVFKAGAGALVEDEPDNASMMQVDMVAEAQSTSDINAFMENLYLRLPLSSIETIRLVEDDARIALSFYYLEDKNVNTSSGDTVELLDENLLEALETIRDYSQN